jgi:NTP pyrophosphatase (non-canonical NTP hydrolase)
MDLMFKFKSKKWRGGAKLIEEMGELIQVLAKMLMVGGLTHWDGNLKQRLMEEMADVSASLYYFKTRNFTFEEIETIRLRAQEKMRKYEQWENKN